jgi:hypothetical protein
MESLNLVPKDRLSLVYFGCASWTRRSSTTHEPWFGDVYGREQNKLVDWKGDSNVTSGIILLVLVGVGGAGIGKY